MGAPVAIGVVGTGWRAEFFARVTQALPEQLTLVGIAARRPERAEEARRRWQVPVVTDLVDAGAKVLTETPPAPDAGALFRLWDRVGSTGRVQVAEQYLSLPGHA